MAELVRGTFRFTAYPRSHGFTLGKYKRIIEFEGGGERVALVCLYPRAYTKLTSTGGTQEPTSARPPREWCFVTLKIHLISKQFFLSVTYFDRERRIYESNVYTWLWNVDRLINYYIRHTLCTTFLFGDKLWQRVIELLFE